MITKSITPLNDEISHHEEEMQYTCHKLPPSELSSSRVTFKFKN